MSEKYNQVYAIKNIFFNNGEKLFHYCHPSYVILNCRKLIRATVNAT